MYMYRTSPKTMVETLMIEHFRVHHKGHKPFPTLGHQWDLKHAFQSLNPKSPLSPLINNPNNSTP